MRTVLIFILSFCFFSGVLYAQSTSPEPIKGYFSKVSSKQLFKIYMKLAKEEFSGMLVIKQTAPAEYRSIFTSGPGIKVFDFTVKNDGYIINYAIGPLTKKFIANRLNYTIEAFLLRNFSGNENVRLVSYEDNVQYYKAGKYGYKITMANTQVQSQTVFFKGRKKATAAFGYLPDSEIPDSGSVIHVGFPLYATFKLLKQ